MSAIARVAALSPFGPIFGKELRTTARRRRNYALRVAYLGGLLLVLLGAWASTRSTFAFGPGGGGAAARAQEQAQLGGNFFAAFSMFCVIAMGVIGPVLTSTSIGSERLAKTLPVLLMTPIGTWQIVSGKLFSRLLVSMTLIGLSLPVLALVRLLGGVELGRMLGVLALCVVAATSAAAIGLFFSTFMNRAYAVILMSYATLALLYLFVPFIMAVGFDINGMRSQHLYAAINPYFCAAMIAMPNGFTLGVAWPPCVATHLALTALLLGSSALILRRMARTAGEQPAGVNPAAYVPAARVAAGTVGPPRSVAPAADDDAAAAPQGVPAPPPLPVTMGGNDNVIGYAQPGTRARRTRPASDVGDNPVLWRETRRPLMAKRWQGVAGAAACVVLLLIAYAALASENDLGDNETQIGFAFVFHGLVWLLCSVLAATAIAQEKESDTWTLLLATPLSGARIVRGKVLGLCRRMMWPMILIVAHFALFTVTGVIPVASLLLILWVIVTFNSLWLATGIFLSLRLRKVTFAVILNLMLAVVAYGAVPLSLFVAGQVLGSHRTGERLATQAAWYVPFSYLAIGIDGLHRDEQGYPYYYNTPGATSDPRARFWVPDARLGALPPGSFANNIHVTKNTYLTIVFCVGCAYLALAALLLWATARHFDRIVGRTPQRRLNDDEIARSRLLAQPSVVS